MSTTVTYKGSTLGVITNESKKLDTAGTWLEADVIITDSSSGGGDNSFIITLSKNNSDEWIPNKTFAEIAAAVLAGKTIAVRTSTSPSTVTADGRWLDDYFEYCVSEIVSGTPMKNIEQRYEMDDEGVLLVDETEYVYPTGTLSITSNGTVNVKNYQYANVNVPTGYGMDDIVQGNFNLSSVTLTTATFIKPFAFVNDKNIESISAPYVTKFGTSTSTGSQTGSYVFANCTKLTTVDLPLLSNPNSGGYQFSGCTALERIFLPLSYAGQYMFNGCTNLVAATIGVQRASVSQWNGNGFRGCSKLQALDVGMCSRIYTNEFINCAVLDTIILRRSDAITPLGNVNAFSNTPFASGKSGGTIYIPKVLYDALGTGTKDYKAATNWSTIDGYGTITWAQIEGSYYETHYADGTLIST